ncbi:hypothetical protein P9112_013832 [Eukaryota sp. TZLM1-RC]
MIVILVLLMSCLILRSDGADYSFLSIENQSSSKTMILHSRSNPASMWDRLPDYNILPHKTGYATITSEYARLSYERGTFIVQFGHNICFCGGCNCVVTEQSQRRCRVSAAC